MSSSTEQPLVEAGLPTPVGPPDLEAFEDRSYPINSDSGDDLDLVRQAQEGCETAFVELALRLEVRRHAHVRHILHQKHLGSADFPDAENVALEATLAAVRRFDRARAEQAGCSFASLVWLLVGRAVCRFADQVKRHERPYDRSPESAEALEEGGHHARRREDPAYAAAIQESLCHARELLAQPSAEKRAVWELMVEEVSVPEIARRLGITERKARRRQEGLKQLMFKELKNYWPDDP